METGISHSQQRPELENIFLSAVEKGEKKTVLVALQHAAYFNVNCIDSDGRTALVIAVQNGNLDILRILLEVRTVVLGDSLLRAVDMNFTPAVRSICECLQQRGKIPNGLYCRSLNGDFHADITPVVLAAHHNSYDILKLLLDLGARIEQPELYNFQTEEFTLEHSVGTINVYRALASQAYISLTSEDPIQTAFHLSYKLQQLSIRDYEFRFQYEQLADQCAQYAADLFGQVRNSHEQVIVLNHNPDEWCLAGDFDEPLKVKQAIRYNQKKFIAHPHCQQRLIERWYEGLPSWRKQRPLRAGLFSILIGFCFPLLAVSYIVSPNLKVSKLLRVPYVRFVCHTASSVVFLFLLTIQAMDIHLLSVTVRISGMQNGEDQVEEYDQHMESNPSEILVMLYVLSSTVTEFKELWAKGARVVKDNVSWKVIDYFTLSLFWMWMALHLVATLKDFETIDVNGTTVLYSNHGGNANGSLNDSWANFNDSSNHAQEQQSEHSALPNNVKIYMDEAVSKIMASQSDVRRNLSNVVRQELDELQTNIIRAIELKLNGGTLESRSRRHKRAVTRLSTTQIGGGRNPNSGLSQDDYSSSNMKYLSSTDPLLIADGLFAIAKVLSFLRLIRMTVVHLQIGPMQISLGRMMIDISKFFGIFCLVWFAFSVGLNQLYFNYAREAKSSCRPGERCGQPYGSVTDALGTLFWTLFGMSDLRSLDITGLDHWFTETVGRVLYAAYHVLAIVVLLNILIAMMSNTYTRIEEDADMQWKYSRSRLWISFYEVNKALPPPFNLFPTVHCVRSWFSPNNKFCGGTERKKKRQNMIEKMDKEYKDVVKQLVHRYIFGMRRASGEDETANLPDPWIMQLKQDVSGFKYDMFETLGNMDSRMKRIQHTVDDKSKDNIDDQKVGNEMLRDLEGAIAAAETEILPVRPQVFRNLANLDDEMLYVDQTQDDFIQDTPEV